MGQWRRVSDAGALARIGYNRWEGQGWRIDVPSETGRLPVQARLSSIEAKAVAIGGVEHSRRRIPRKAERFSERYRLAANLAAESQFAGGDPLARALLSTLVALGFLPAG